MGFGQGLSGLNAAAQNLDVIGNNIANSGTVGYKTASATFADVYANSRVGLGVQLTGVNQRFTVGNQRYCAVRMLGTLGVGERILARAEGPGSEGELVVLKRLHAAQRPDDRRRFLEEARLLRMLDHPSIARLLAVAPRAQQPLLVMEYVEGLSLERVLSRAARRRKPMSAPFSAYVAAEANATSIAAAASSSEK